MVEFLLTKNMLAWEQVQLNPKLMIGGSLYRCPKCKKEVLVPYGRSITNYKYCNKCKEPLKVNY